MIGAIIGDIVGSRFEFHNIKTKDFALFTPHCFFTDDTVMTLAVAEAIMNSAAITSGSFIRRPAACRDSDTVTPKPATGAASWNGFSAMIRNRITASATERPCA